MNLKLVKANIIYTKPVKLYLRKLVNILYLKGYFSFHEYARQYVISLIKDMEATIHLKMKRKAPFYFSRYGKDLWYISYPKNKRTTWYFFFNLYENETYVIRYITNNHVAGHLLE